MTLTLVAGVRPRKVSVGHRVLARLGGGQGGCGQRGDEQGAGAHAGVARFIFCAGAALIEASEKAAATPRQSRALLVTRMA